MYTIVKIMLDELVKRVERKGVLLEPTVDLKLFLMNYGYDPAYGARPLRRAITEKVEDVIAESLLKDDISIGDNLYLHSGDMYIKRRGSETRITLVLKDSDEGRRLEREWTKFGLTIDKHEKEVLKRRGDLGF